MEGAKEMTREEWLEERKKGIGGSDAATILGLNPYKTNIQIVSIGTQISVTPSLSLPHWCTCANPTHIDISELAVIKLNGPPQTLKSS